MFCIIFFVFWFPSSCRLLCHLFSTSLVQHACVRWLFGQAFAPPSCMCRAVFACLRNAWPMLTYLSLSRGVLLPPLALDPSPSVAWAATHSDANRLPMHSSLPSPPILTTKGRAPLDASTQHVGRFSNADHRRLSISAAPRQT